MDHDEDHEDSEALMQSNRIKDVGTMFNVGDYVLHQTTGNIGRVIGYGHQILEDGYTTTLKVLVDHALASNKRGIVEEDLYSAWVKW